MGRRALERRGRETSGSLEQRKRPALWEADGLRGLGRAGPPCERGMKLMRSTNLRSVWLAARIWGKGNGLATKAG